MTGDFCNYVFDKFGIIGGGGGRNVGNDGGGGNGKFKFAGNEGGGGKVRLGGNEGGGGGSGKFKPDGKGGGGGVKFMLVVGFPPNLPYKSFLFSSKLLLFPTNYYFFVYEEVDETGCFPPMCFSSINLA